MMLADMMNFDMARLLPQLSARLQYFRDGHDETITTVTGCCHAIALAARCRAVMLTYTAGCEPGELELYENG